MEYQADEQPPSPMRQYCEMNASWQRRHLSIHWIERQARNRREGAQGVFPDALLKPQRKHLLMTFLAAGIELSV